MKGNMKKQIQNTLLSRMKDGIPTSVIDDKIECCGKDGCPAIGIDVTGKHLRMIGSKLTSKQKMEFEAQTGAHVGRQEVLIEIPLALLEAAGFSKK